MTLVRYEPFHYEFGDTLSQLHRQINRVFDRQLAANTDAGSSAATSVVAEWIPPADIAEYADRFVLKFDVPGVDVSAIEITLDRGVLTLSGERQADAAGKDVERSRRERPHGRFHRRFTLPDTVDAAAVRATGSNGILEVTIPKQPKAQPRRIEVAAA